VRPASPATCVAVRERDVNPFVLVVLVVLLEARARDEAWAHPLSRPQGYSDVSRTPTDQWSREMHVRRVVPNLQSSALPQTAEFYGVLGLEEVMNLGWITTLASAGNPVVQLSLMTEDRTAPLVPDLSIEVEDVDAAYAAMRERGAEIVHPLTDEEWGVRRFFVRDPGGRVVNVLSHR
jgi:catechol 2,3-dioxygenase-like lactoylglutathione lyase family enzyme